jgi:Protein of unknown function (DUF3224)
MHVNGPLGGRSGSFVPPGHGSFHETTAWGESTVVAGSGTAGLPGLTGTAESASTHAVSIHGVCDLRSRPRWTALSSTRMPARKSRGPASI